MAGDWIKMEKCTPDKPEVRTVARMCSVSPGEAFLALFRVWSWADSATEDGHLVGTTQDDVDEIARLPRCGEAMEEVGWMRFSASGAEIGNWTYHNGLTAKARALKGRRQQRWRSRGGDYVDGRAST